MEGVAVAKSLIALIQTTVKVHWLHQRSRRCPLLNGHVTDSQYGAGGEQCRDKLGHG